MPIGVWFRRLVAAPAPVRSAPPGSPRVWVGRVVLAVLPVAVAIAFYHPELVTGGKTSLGPDGHFYVYQMGRVAELNGAWWRLGDDPRVGAPYPTGAAKNPGLYEGLDLMAVAAVAGQWLPPRSTTVLVGLLALAFNGWLTGWFTTRLTGSWWAAALAVVLVTVNQPTLGRYGEHLHLYKYGWVLLTVWAFSQHLDAPSRRNGVRLGLAAAATLLASFHFGFFLALGLGVWWLGCLATRTLGWGHLKAAGVAVAVGGAVAAAGTFPVWAAQAGQTQARLYHQRNFVDLWVHSAELWQYVTPPATPAAEARLKGAGRFDHPAFSYLTDAPLDRHTRAVFDNYGTGWGGWNYLGWGMLGGLGVFAVLRLRGHPFGVDRPVVLDRLAGLLGLLVVLSLSGGPGVLLYDLVPQFRCYGRAGLLAVPLAAVLAAVAARAAVLAIPFRIGRWAVAAGVVAVVAHDWQQTARYKIPPAGDAPPAWSDWLAAQPPDVRLAAFPALDRTYCWGEVWHWESLGLSLEHRHPTLNGAEFALLLADLDLLGSGYHLISPAGLRFVSTLGYDALAFDEEMLKRCPWVGRLPWLHKQADLAGGWTVWRVAADAPRFPTTTRGELLRGAVGGTREVPAGVGLTLPLEVREPTVVTDAAAVEMAWVDEGGAAGPWARVLEQRVYGPGLAAVVTRAPVAGTWRLRFRDARTLEVLAEQAVRVRSDLATGEGVPTSSVSVQPLDQLPDGGGVVRLRNTTDRYLTARQDDPTLTHPTLKPIQPQAMFLLLRTRVLNGTAEEQFEVRTLLPCDLPPGGEVRLVVPVGVLGTTPGPGREVVSALYSAPSVVKPVAPSAAEVVVELRPGER